MGYGHAKVVEFGSQKLTEIVSKVLQDDVRTMKKRRRNEGRKDLIYHWVPSTEWLGKFYCREVHVQSVGGIWSTEDLWER